MPRAASQITPFVLTFNEADNVRRTLESLRWAERVVVVDSGSTDATESIARSFPNVAWYLRAFDSFRGQSEFAINETSITTPFALALDADMVVPDALLAELESGFWAGGYAGALTPFEFRVHGAPLKGSLLRPQLRLFLRDAVRVVQEGHGHKFDVAGPVYTCRARIVHDDRKPLERWVSSQLGYSRAERIRILEAISPTMLMRLRRAGVMPILAGVYAYLSAGGPFAGTAAKHYAWERVVFECLLSMRLIEAENNAKDA
jgi:hypothetical protein